MVNLNYVKWPGWETVREIGKGSLGSVFEIQRTENGRTEKGALKLISVPKEQNEIAQLLSGGMDRESIALKYRSRVEDIVKAYSRMANLPDQRRIVRIEDLHVQPHADNLGWDILVRMEHLTPLSKWADSDPETLARRVGDEVSEALSLLQAQNLLHGNLNPENILLTEDGSCKLGDIGIAKAAEQTMDGKRLGKYTFLAPETFKKAPFGPEADQYSLGLVLYWLLNERRLPFLPLPPQTPTAEQEKQAFSDRLYGKALPAPANGGAKLRETVLKACAYQPVDRFADPGALQQALRQKEPEPFVQEDAFRPAAAASVVQEETFRPAAAGGFVPPQPAQSGSYQPPVQPAYNQEAATGIHTQGNKAPRHLAPAKEQKKQKKPLWILIPAILAVIGIAVGIGIAVSKAGNKPEQPQAEKEWSEWQDQLPAEVSADKYEIEEKKLYSSRKAEIKTSTESDKMEGYELFKTESEDKTSDWSDWSAEEIKASDTLEVETKTQYRHRDLETKTGDSEQMEGWELVGSEDSFGEYGAWSEWSESPAEASDTREVEQKTQYSYQMRALHRMPTFTQSLFSGSSGGELGSSGMGSDDGDGGSDDGGAGGMGGGGNSGGDSSGGSGADSGGSSGGSGDSGGSSGGSGGGSSSPSWSAWSDTDPGSGFTVRTRVVYRYRDRSKTTTYTFQRYGEWSGWSDTEEKASDNREVEKQTLYRSREKSTASTYYFRKWSDWSEYDEKPVEPSEDTEVQTKTVYRYREK